MRIALDLPRRALFSCVRKIGVGAIFVPSLLCGALFTQVFASQVTRSISNTWTVTIVLPPRLMAGHPATLGVLGVDGKLAAGVQVDLGNGQRVTTDRNGRALFTVPVSGDYLFAKASGASAAALIDPASGASEPKSVSLPPVVSVRDRFWICGAGLSGDADANSVRINGKPAVVLAASPVCVVVLAELDTGTGPASILVQAPGVQWTAATTLVSLEFAPPKPALQPGQKGQIAIRVDGTSQKLRLVVEDRNPGVLRFEGGDERGDARRVTTSGGPTNIAEIKVQAITSGDYSLRARLVPTPDAHTAKRFLVAAESLAPEDSRRRVSELASRLAHKPNDLENVEVALDKIATQTMTGDFRTLLDAARGVF
ncbi:MAG TPA: hypothetical protein VGR97_15165 [Candidatus Acidoferrales bacterium]|nr:hypothetical protein [Candidatus Acidoferrales bacterium]